MVIRRDAPVIMSISREIILSASFLLISRLFLLQFSAAIDSINGQQSIRDGETLVSSNGVYELGFFSPGNSRNRYVGLWYRNITVRTYIWVANREAPMTNSTGAVLRVVGSGNLVLFDSSNGVVWSTNATRSVQNPIAQLLDSGNLIVRDARDNRPENFIWQSFEHPTDTYWTGVKIGWNLRTRSESYLSSWRSDDDPARGEYSFRMDLTGFPQIFLDRGSNATHRVGPWNGLHFSGGRGDPTFRLMFVMNQDEVYYWSTTNRTDILSKFTLNKNGIAQRSTWVDQRGWMPYLTVPGDTCDDYDYCGAYGRCDAGSSPICSCLDKFVPRDPNGWVQGDWRNGCLRRSNLSCQGDIFLKYSGIKFPDARNSSYNTSMTPDECRVECLRNCSCMAYSQLDVSRGIGCLMWYGDLNDVRTLPASRANEVYIRMASSEANMTQSTDSLRRNRKTLIVGVALGVGLVLIICLSLFLFLYRWKRKKDAKMVKQGLVDENHARNSELPLFDLSVIMKATNHFSFNNKLGEGGFGTVCKGKLDGGLEIAVKRLSKDSGQGFDEFKNEVIFIAKLQHRNLVRLLGCCIEGEERMLIYECVPNKSLDGILFDQKKSMLLDWPKRFNIINGIARGLLYLHQDSRLRIIHRDLKASNVLLDADMNPKISDFGIARSFGGNETEAKTRRVVGTYGYMSPEYAVDGLFSMKSDVFSYGVLVLEIVSGKRNRGFFHSDHNLNLLGHAWCLYKEERSLELVDPSLGISSCHYSEVLRSIHVGLLCVQQHPEDRPTMSSVILMLGNEGVLPEAKQPGFFMQRDILVGESSNSTNAANSTSELTITMPEPR